MLGWRLLLATGEPRFADLVERTLFNVVATSPSADGRSFFYANTLHRRHRGMAPRPDVDSPRADSGLRAPWFAVSCCPTNVARTLAQLPGYLATADEEGVQLHQYADADLATSLTGGRGVALRVRTDYPSGGTVTVRITRSPAAPWTLSLRVPQWAAGAPAWLVDPDGVRRPAAPARRPSPGSSGPATRYGSNCPSPRAGSTPTPASTPYAARSPSSAVRWCTAPSPSTSRTGTRSTRYGWTRPSTPRTGRAVRGRGRHRRGRGRGRRARRTERGGLAVPAARPPARTAARRPRRDRPGALPLLGRSGPLDDAGVASDGRRGQERRRGQRHRRGEVVVRGPRGRHRHRTLARSRHCPVR